MQGIIYTLLAILVHETGHVVASKIVGVPLVSLAVKPVGMSMRFDFCRVGYFREAVVHLGGPIAGVLTAALALLMFQEKCITFCGISTVLSVVNLLPISGFDGGGVLLCILSSVLRPDIAEKISRAVSAVFLLILWGSVLWIELRVGANLSLIAFVLFFMLKVM